MGCRWVVGGSCGWVVGKLSVGCWWVVGGYCWWVVKGLVIRLSVGLVGGCR